MPDRVNMLESRHAALGVGDELQVNSDPRSCCKQGSPTSATLDLDKRLAWPCRSKMSPSLLPRSCSTRPYGGTLLTIRCAGATK